MYRYNYICRYKHLNLERDMTHHEMGNPHIKRTVRIHRLAHHGNGQTLIEIARHYVGLFRCCFFECSKHRLLAACGFCGRRCFGGRWCFFVRSSKTYTPQNTFDWPHVLHYIQSTLCPTMARRPREFQCTPTADQRFQMRLPRLQLRSPILRQLRSPILRRARWARRRSPQPRSRWAECPSQRRLRHSPCFL